MEKTTDKPYEAWLTTIANTRLIFNKLETLEDFLDNHSIHNNGIRRSFPTEQKLRSAYRDLKEEVLEQTDNNMDLSEILRDYKRASRFYQDQLARRRNPRTLALDLLNYQFKPMVKTPIKKSQQKLFRKLNEEEIDVGLLVLLLLKVLPGYDSKSGDVDNIFQDFEQMISLFGEFMQEDPIFKSIPTLILAKDEKKKSRLKLIYHAYNILGTYLTYTSRDELHSTNNDLKKKYMPLDMAGYWNECGGTDRDTEFWQFEETDNAGIFFALKWKKGPDNTILLGIYTATFLEYTESILILYMLHPEAMKNRVNGKPFTERDHTWYRSEMPSDMHCNELKFVRNLSSPSWKERITLTRVTDGKLISLYDSWIEHCKTVNPYESAQYEFSYALYAITHEYLYILTLEKETEIEYFQVRRDLCEGMGSVNLDDNVGILTLGGKRYIAFDDLMIYWEITDKNLKDLDIKRTKLIE